METERGGTVARDRVGQAAPRAWCRSRWRVQSLPVVRSIFCHILHIQDANFLGFNLNLSALESLTELRSYPPAGSY
jgi:hypothetical protein